MLFSTPASAFQSPFGSSFGVNALETKETPVCSFFLRGRCRKGTGCPFKHERPSKNGSSASSGANSFSSSPFSSNMNNGGSVFNQTSNAFGFNTNAQSNGQNPFGPSSTPLSFSFQSTPSTVSASNPAFAKTSVREDDGKTYQMNSITAMPFYQSKSPEELRLQHYQSPSTSTAASAASATNFFNMSNSTPSTTASSNPWSAFGTVTPTSPATTAQNWNWSGTAQNTATPSNTNPFSVSNLTASPFGTSIAPSQISANPFAASQTSNVNPFSQTSANPFATSQTSNANVTSANPFASSQTSSNLFAPSQTSNANPFSGFNLPTTATTQSATTSTSTSPFNFTPTVTQNTANQNPFSMNTPSTSNSVSNSMNAFNTSTNPFNLMSGNTSATNQAAPTNIWSPMAANAAAPTTAPTATAPTSTSFINFTPTIQTPTSATSAPASNSFINFNPTIPTANAPASNSFLNFTPTIQTKTSAAVPAFQVVSSDRSTHQTKTLEAGIADKPFGAIPEIIPLTRTVEHSTLKTKTLLYPMPTSATKLRPRSVGNRAVVSETISADHIKNYFVTRDYKKSVKFLEIIPDEHEDEVLSKAQKSEDNSAEIKHLEKKKSVSESDSVSTTSGTLNSVDSIPMHKPVAIRGKLKPQTLESLQQQDADFHPKLSKSGYYTVPSIETLKTYSKKQLSEVDNFVIGLKGVGNIRFLEPVDICNVNFDTTVIFSRGEAVIYPDGHDTPEVGCGLNKSAVICLEGVFPKDKKTNTPKKDKQSLERFKKTLQKSTVQSGATFLDYNPDNGQWKFHITHL